MTTGLSIGRVTERKVRQAEAPSSAAASCSSFGISWRPPYRMTMLNGMPIQMLTRMTESRAISGLVSQGV